MCVAPIFCRLNCTTTSHFFLVLPFAIFSRYSRCLVSPVYPHPRPLKKIGEMGRGRCTDVSFQQQWFLFARFLSQPLPGIGWQKMYSRFFLGLEILPLHGSFLVTSCASDRPLHL